MSDSPTTDENGRWAPIKEAAELTDQKERNIRLWKDNGKIRSKTFEDRANAPVFVLLEDIEQIAEERAERQSQKTSDLLPIPVKAFEEIQNLTNRLLQEARERTKAETQLEFFKERVRDLEAQKAAPILKVPKFEPAKRRWYERKLRPEPVAKKETETE